MVLLNILLRKRKSSLSPFHGNNLYSGWLEALFIGGQWRGSFMVGFNAAYGICYFIFWSFPLPL